MPYSDRRIASAIRQPRLSAWKMSLTSPDSADSCARWGYEWIPFVISWFRSDISVAAKLNSVLQGRHLEISGNQLVA